MPGRFDNRWGRAGHLLALVGRYVAAQCRYHLLLPWTDRRATRRFFAAVLEQDFFRGAGRRLPTESIHAVFPELRSLAWVTVGIAWSIETPILCGAARALNARRVVEIGTFEGAMTVQLAANLPTDGRIVTVDIDPEEVSAALAPPAGSDVRLTQKPRDRIGRLYRGTPWADRIVQVIADSARVNYTDHFDALDLAYIDGGHSYDQVRADTERILPLVRPGGAVFWHDYRPGCAGVVRYLHELAGHLPLRHVRGTQLAVYRKPDGE
ncbi:MAG: class I SAM-dependent methyltransferase [Phycisphaerales bacterium]|nr:class I SAM-dependent methyltransferase [Phycisphaerales bacterium]